MAPIPTDVKEYVALMDEKLEHEIKRWIMASVLAQVAAMVPVIFLLGGIYSTGAASMELVKAQQAELVQRGLWMQDREMWELQMQTWAENKGYTPPRYRRKVKEQ